ncbi:cysteine hydrolase [Mycoplasma sp. Pen4]|uniref:cysteine hydrolase family protein n=1 Tax=Mycoplasma sp. Pen4 TaxID=640330 RepID=UPI001654B82A|nr:isochorismatase family cysteine hydrolase [Mycoplasma sp. Pen4]QNM93487.1 cysteine hydrolase [Mycoplasma sp. Pen4]
MNNKPLVIVVDMLNGFIKHGPLASKNIGEIIPTIKNVIENHDDTIFVSDHHSENDLEMKYYPEHCLAGTDESEIVDELKQFAHKIYYKNTTNAFWDLPSSLWEQYNEFIIVGCCTDICILNLAITLKTFLNKINSDKQVIVLDDAVATFDTKEHPAKKAHLSALEIMKSSGVKIQRWEQ